MTAEHVLSMVAQRLTAMAEIMRSHGVAEWLCAPAVPQELTPLFCGGRALVVLGLEAGGEHPVVAIFGDQGRALEHLSHLVLRRERLGLVVYDLDTRETVPFQVRKEVRWA